MNDAAALMEQAKSDIQRFQRELEMCRFLWICAWKSAASLLLCGFLFLDGLVADYMVQSKIGRCKRTGG